MSESLIQQIENSKVEQSSSDKYKEQGKRDLKNSLNKAWEILGKVKGTPLYSRFRKNYDNLVENIKQAVEKDKSISIAERNKIIREYKEMFLLERNVKKQEQGGVNLLEKGKNIVGENLLKIQYGNDIIEKGYAKNYILLYKKDKGNFVIPIINFQKEIKNNYIQNLNKRGLLSYFNFLKSKNQISRASLIKEFGSEKRVNELLNFLNEKRNNDSYLNQVWGMVERLLEEQSKNLNYLQKKGKNLAQELIIRKKLGGMSGFGNNKLQIYNKIDGNNTIDISTFEIQMRGIKNINELNRLGLYNYIQYLKSKGWFNDDFIQKFNNPFLKKSILEKFEISYENKKNKNLLLSFYKKGEELEKKTKNNLTHIKNNGEKAIKSIQNIIEGDFQEEKKKNTYQYSKKTEYKKGKNTISNSPRVKKGGEKELPLKYEKGEKIQINMGGRNINVHLKEMSNGGYTLFYRGKPISKELTKKEGELIKKNPEAGGNILRFYRFYDFINLGSVWKYRNKLIHAIDKVGINKDDDFLNEAEFLRFGNTIISFINKSGGGNLQEAHNLRELGEIFKNFSLSNHILDKRAKNSKNEDKFAELLRNNGVLLDGSFNTIKFQKILNSQQKKS